MSASLQWLARARAGDVAAQRRIRKEFEPLLIRVIEQTLRRANLSWSVALNEIPRDLIPCVWRQCSLDQIITEDELATALCDAAEQVVQQFVLGFIRSLNGCKASQINTNTQLVRTDSKPLLTKLYGIRDGLSCGEKKVLKLRYLGWSWAEIGRLFGEKPSTMRMRFSRAVQRAHKDR